MVPPDAGPGNQAGSTCQPGLRGPACNRVDRRVYCPPYLMTSAERLSPRMISTVGNCGVEGAVFVTGPGFVRRLTGPGLFGAGAYNAAVGGAVLVLGVVVVPYTCGCVL